MSQTPITLEYELKELLTNLSGKMDKIDEKVTRLEIGQAEIKGEIKALDERLSGQIKVLDEKVSGLSKRVDNQEILNRITLGGVILVILGGAAKMFSFLPNP